MRKLFAWFTALILLCGCSGSDPDYSSCLKLREEILQAEKCTFQCSIIADYKSYCYSFLLDCTAVKNGRLEFTVIEPEPIRGIGGFISGEKGGITFDQEVLIFPSMTDGALTPVSAPWIFMSALREGYVCSVGSKSDRMHVSIEDTYFDQYLRIEIELNKDNLPETAVIYCDGSAFLTLKIIDFQIL